jgi:hypothetical protein
MTRPRIALGGRSSYDSPKGDLGREHKNALWATDGLPDDLPSKACPRAATKLDELDPGRRRLDDRVIR